MLCYPFVPEQIPDPPQSPSHSKTKGLRIPIGILSLLFSTSLIFNSPTPLLAKSH